MGKKALRKTSMNQPIDCACVIHGEYYQFDYVDKLYNGLIKNLSRPVNLHVYTEESRHVPEPYIHHPLQDLGVSGPRKSWWYKLQLFDNKNFNGQLLYFDLDVVIVDNIDFLVELSTKYFWGIRDFRYLFSPSKRTLNSSIMYFNTEVFSYVWDEFQKHSQMHMSRLHGDQDFIDRVIPAHHKQFFNEELIKSWRWQCLDGGYDTRYKQHKSPGTGTTVAHPTRVMIFHGKPKLHEINDPIIAKYW